MHHQHCNHFWDPTSKFCVIKCDGQETNPGLTRRQSNKGRVIYYAVDMASRSKLVLMEKGVKRDTRERRLYHTG